MREMNFRLQLVVTLVLGFLSHPLEGWAVEKGKFSQVQICKAGIAVIMGREPRIIKIDKVREEVIYLSYTRANDRTHWKYKCKIEGQKIIWGSEDGRWRTHPKDEVVTFDIKGSVLMIEERYSDGSSTKESFTAQQLGR